MAFQFALESVLRLRRSKQRQQDLLLQKVNEQVNRLLRELQDVAAEFARIYFSGKSESEVRGAELEFRNAQCVVLAEHRMQIEHRLRQAREQQAQASSQFQRIWQRREVLETLRGREHQSYLLEQGRREQRTQDDLFLFRKKHTR